MSRLKELFAGTRRNSQRAPRSDCTQREILGSCKLWRFTEIRAGSEGWSQRQKIRYLQARYSQRVRMALISKCPRRLLGARRSLVGMNDLGRNYETWDNNQMDLKIMSFNLNVKMKEKWFQLPLSGYVQRVGFYAFLIHSSTLSEVVFCATSAYLSPCTRVYVRGLSPSGRIF